MNEQLDRRAFLTESSLAVLAVVAARGAAAEESKSPLDGLPSKPGKHLDKIKALGDDAWLNLGSPAADPK